MDGTVKRWTRGLTLVETLLAMVVLAIAILGLAAVFVSGLKMVRASVHLTASTNIAREILETSKKRGYSQTSVGTFDGHLPTPQDPATGFPPAPYPTTTIDQHQYTTVIRCRDFSPTIRAIEVDVFWDGDSKTTLATMVHQ